MREFDQLKFRKAMGCYLTGVTVVTTLTKGELVGVTINSFNSVSLNPPLISFCLNKASSKLTTFRDTEYFAVNILSSSQENIANYYAFHQGTIGNIFSDFINWRFVNGAVAHIGCKRYCHYEGGDHLIILGEVKHVDYNTSTPLGHLRGQYTPSPMRQDY